MRQRGADYFGRHAWHPKKVPFFLFLALFYVCFIEFSFGFLFFLSGFRKREDERVVVLFIRLGSNNCTYLLIVIDKITFNSSYKACLPSIFFFMHYWNLAMVILLLTQFHRSQELYIAATFFVNEIFNGAWYCREICLVLVQLRPFKALH